MKALGCDPGITEPCIAIVATRGISYTLERFWMPELSSDAPADDRIRLVTTKSISMMRLVDLVAVEELHGTFFGKLKKKQTNASAAKLLELVGAVEGAALARKRKFVKVSPQQVRATFGLRPNASKADVARAVRIRCTGIPDDAPEALTDAIGIAIAGEKRWHRCHLGERTV